MIGTALVEELVQSVALSHLVEGRERANLLLLAAPESGKTSIVTAARCPHVQAISVITGRSVLEHLKTDTTQFFVFNDMAAIRSLSKQTSALLIVLLNQITAGETGVASFAGKESIQINRPIGVIGCMPFSLFVDRRAHWKEVGFVSRMIPFSYSYRVDLIATIKNHLDRRRPTRSTARHMPPVPKKTFVDMRASYTTVVRALSDARAITLGQIGIRLLKNYHVLIRAHALLHKRHVVTERDVEFLRAVDQFVSITECKQL